MNMSGRLHDTRAEVLLLLVILIWAANYPLAKFGIEGLNPFVFNAIRFVVATVVILAIVPFGGSWIRIASRDRAKFLRAGVVANVVYQVAFIIGLDLSTAGNSAILLSTSPLWTVVIYAKLHHERIRRSVLTGMLISLAGIATIVAGGGSELHLSVASLAGDFICLGAAVLWAMNTNMQKPLLSRYSSLEVSLVMVAIGAAGLVALAVPSALAISWGSVPWSCYGAAVASGALSIGLGNVIWSFGVKRLGPGRTGNFSNLIPVLALVLSYAFLSEPFSVLQCVGAAVTIAGVWSARH